MLMPTILDRDSLADVLRETAASLTAVKEFSYPDFGSMFDRLDRAKEQKVVKPAPRILRDAFSRVFLWLPEIASQLRSNSADANARNQISGLIARIRRATGD